MTNLKPALMLAAAIGAATLLSAAAASAQRDPAYQAARDSGAIGEKPDGYLGFVGTPTKEVEALVNDLNIQRKKKYTESAEAAGTTIEKFAETSGCNLILKTVPGERYMTPDGIWKVRGTDAPIRDASCP
jgi:uncharacterized protein YdbL (DUF1318 family)